MIIYIFFKAIYEFHSHYVLIDEFSSGDFVDVYTVQYYEKFKTLIKFRNKRQLIEGLST